jgi:cleavage and polyadenylation specificity factor subunit 2
MLEWMDENIVPLPVRDICTFRRFKFANNVLVHPLQHASGESDCVTFKHLKIIERKKRLEKLLAEPGPKVILASDTSK